MKKMLFVLAVFLLALFVCPAAADEAETPTLTAPISPAPEADCLEVLIEPVPHNLVVKWILFGKYGEDRIGLLSSFVNSLKEEPVSFYLYVIEFDQGSHGVGEAYSSSMFSGSANPSWKVPECRFTAETGYVYAGWMIYGNHVFPGEESVLTEYNTRVTPIWKVA